MAVHATKLPKKVERSTTRALARTLQAIGSGKSVPLEIG